MVAVHRAFAIVGDSQHADECPGDSAETFQGDPAHPADPAVDLPLSGGCIGHDVRLGDHADELIDVRHHDPEEPDLPLCDDAEGRIEIGDLLVDSLELRPRPSIQTAPARTTSPPSKAPE